MASACPSRPHQTLAVILLVAGYLCIAAITVIPELDISDGAPAADVAELAATLAAADRGFSPGDAPKTAEEPWSPLQSGKGGLPENVRDDLTAQRRERSTAATELGNFTHYWRTQVELAKAQTLDEFRQSALRRGEIERRQHYGLLLRWYDVLRHDANREVSECYRAFDMANHDSLHWAESTAEALASKSVQRKSDARWAIAVKECADRWQVSPPPPRPELGSRLGPFSFIAKWLLKTESQSLVAIVGLLGFGLLGAATSTIIRHQPTVRTILPLVPDLPLVMIRGVSAAVVIFLAVKGGLAVFAAGAPEPNAYVLMLTCFIGAVFSEPVWEGARAYLLTLVKRWGANGGTQAHSEAGSTTADAKKKGGEE